MRSIGKFFKSIFMFLYNVLDKLLITPICRLLFGISGKTKNRNFEIEKALKKPHVLIIMSLIFAVGIFFLVNSRVISLVETEAEVISDQKVNVIYNEEAYVVEGIPNTVDITLIGRKSDLYLSKQLGEHIVSLDLSGLGVGEHKVKLTYTQTIDTIDYRLDPSSVLVIIKEKVSTIKSISYDLLNQDKLNSKLSVGKVELDRSEVVIKGSAEAIEKVATVKALIDLNNEDLTEAGSYTLDNLPLVAYDEKGKAINNVEIVPKKVSATVELDSYSSEVPIKVNLKGSPTTGYAIESANSSVAKVTIYGDQATLETIKSIPVEVDVSKLSENKNFNITITKPSGVRQLSETSTTVEVKIGKESSKEVADVAVETRNLGSGLTANAGSIEDTKITVIAKGVQSVLDNLDASKITAYVDLTGYEAGTRDVPIVLESSDERLELIAKVKTINVIISAK